MAERANVTSIEILEVFRTSLIIYVDKIDSALSEISEEIGRTRQWIESDRRAHWEGEFRRRARALDQAEQELYSASLQSMHDSHARQKMMVAKARRAREEAEEKLKVIKKWSRDFESVVESRAKKLESLRSFVGHDLAKAIAFLTESLKALEAYADLRPAGAAGGGAGSAPQEEKEETPEKNKS